MPSKCVCLEKRVSERSSKQLQNSTLQIAIYPLLPTFVWKLNSNPFSAHTDRSLESISETLMFRTVPCCLTFGSLPFCSWSQMWLGRCLVYEFQCTSLAFPKGRIPWQKTDLFAYKASQACRHVTWERWRRRVPTVWFAGHTFSLAFFLVLESHSLLYFRYILSSSTLSCFHPACQPVHCGLCLWCYASLPRGYESSPVFFFSRCQL